MLQARYYKVTALVLVIAANFLYQAYISSQNISENKAISAQEPLTKDLVDMAIGFKPVGLYIVFYSKNVLC